MIVYWQLFLIFMPRMSSTDQPYLLY